MGVAINISSLFFGYMLDSFLLFFFFDSFFAHTLYYPVVWATGRISLLLILFASPPCMRTFNVKMAEATLPPPWVAHDDAGSGKKYYFNAETNETSWELPVAHLPASLAPPTPPSVMMAALASSPVAIETMTHAVPAVVTVSAPAAALPASTEQRTSLAAVDPATGRTYYYDPATRETTWAPFEETTAPTQVKAPSISAAPNPALMSSISSSAAQGAADPPSVGFASLSERHSTTADTESEVGDPGSTIRGKVWRLVLLSLLCTTSMHR